MRSGIYLVSWNFALLVVLEKRAEVRVVKKLRHISLYEAAFNFFQQFVLKKNNAFSNGQYTTV